MNTTSRLSTEDRRRLSWLQQWARAHLTRIKRGRKYRPRERIIDPDEADVLSALVNLEKGAKQMLKR